MNLSLKRISLTGEMIKSHVMIIKLLRPKSTYISNSIHIKAESRTVTVRLFETKCWVFRHLHWVRIKPCRTSREESASREYKPVSKKFEHRWWPKYRTAMLVTTMSLRISVWDHHYTNFIKIFILSLNGGLDWCWWRINYGDRICWWKVDDRQGFLSTLVV